jgi:hypothetical protein
VGRNSGDFIFVTGQNRLFLHRAHGLAEPVFLTKEAFISSFAHERRGTDDDREGPTAWYLRWMEEHPHQLVEKLTFVPGAPSGRILDQGVRAWNVWERPSIQPMAGDIQPWLSLQHHLGIDDVDWEYLLDALAAKLQNPALKIRWITLLGGQQGIGKDSLLAPIAYLLGPMWGEVGAEQLRKDFNGFLFRKEVVLISEAFRSRQKDLLAAVESKLKLWSSQSTIPIEFKGVNVVNHPNFLWLFMTTNYRDAVPVAQDDRRFFAIWCKATYSRDQLDSYAKWWAWYHTDWIPNGGAAIVLDYLMRRDVSHFNPGQQPPLTEWNELLREVNLSDYDEFFYEMRHFPRGAWALPFALWQDLLSDAITHGLSADLHHPGRFRTWLRKSFPRIERRVSYERRHYYVIGLDREEILNKYASYQTHNLRETYEKMLTEARGVALSDSFAPVPDGGGPPPPPPPSPNTPQLRIVK